MAHGRNITSRQLLSLRDEPFQNNNLRGYIDNAGQTLWVGMLPSGAEAREKLAIMMGQPEDAAPVTQAYSQLFAFNSSAFSGPLVTREPRYPKEQMHRYLSLAYHLQPESEDSARSAIEQGLEKLGLGAPLSKDTVQQELPQLLASLSIKREH